MTSSSASGEVLVGQLADEFIERLRRGDSPTIDEYASKYPDIAEDIRELFPTLESMEQVSLEQSNGATIPADPLPERLGDYRIVRKLGYGGMGVVYEAEQESLGRHVALKVLPRGAVAGKDNLKRFYFEARAAAGLHHPNIVPVFGVGHDSDVHFYAMQFIPGQGLDLILDELREMKSDSHGQGRSLMLSEGIAVSSSTTQSRSTRRKSNGDSDGSGSSISSATLAAPLTRQQHYYRSVARIGADVADALAYAHNEGVLHRDIKPSNLLLDPDGTIWVTDFGLAKSVSEDLTNSGELVGTLRYMAPERLQGDSEPSSDIYSLGLTLYEMLTLRPAFSARDRAELIRQISQDAPLRPRRIDPSIPRDLETVVLKAIERNATARYVDAGDLAADLRRFLASKPIIARRTSPRERLWMWCRRNPLAAGLTAGLAILLLLLGTGYRLHVSELRSALRRAEGAEQRERVANRTARKRLLESYIAEAESVIRTVLPGRRTNSLQAIENATHLLDQIDLERREEVEMTLRNQAIAALALVDIRRHTSWPAPDSRGHLNNPRWGFDSRVERYVHGTDNGDVVIRSVVDNRVLQRFDHANPKPTSPQRHFFCFSPDGRFVAQYVSNDQQEMFVQVMDLQQERVLLAEPIRSYGAPQWKPLCFDPQSEFLYHLDQQSQLCRLQLQAGTSQVLLADVPSFNFEVSPDGLSIALVRNDYQQDHTIEFVSIPDGQLIRTIQAPAPVFDHSWSPDGRLFGAACSDQNAYIWRGDGDGSLLSICAGHNGTVRQLEFSSNGLLVTSSWDETTRIWDPLLGQELIRIEQFGNVRFSHDGDWLGFALAGRDVARMEMLGNEECLVLNGWGALNRSGTESLSFSHDSRWLASASSYDGISLWDTRNGNRILQSRPYERTKTVAFAPDHQHLLASGNSQMDCWDLIDQGDRLQLGERRLLHESSESINTIFDLSDTGRVLASERLVSVAAFELDSGAALGRYENQDWVNHLSVSPDGRWAACGSWSQPFSKVWSLDSGELVLRHRLDTRGCIPRFSPDGNWLAVCTTDRVEFVSVANWQVEFTIDRGEPGYSNIAFAPDMSMAAISNMSAVDLYDLSTRHKLATLRGPNQAHLTAAHPDVSPLAFSPDGKMLAVGTYRDSILLWKLDLVRERLQSMSLDW